MLCALRAKRHNPARTRFCGSRAPRRKQTPCRRRAKDSPRGRASPKKQKLTPIACTDPLLWEPRPRGERNFLPAQSQKLRPEVGPPTKNKSSQPWPARTRFCGSRAPAAKANSLPAQSEKLRPEVGPPTKNKSSQPWPARTRVCGSRAPAAKTISCRRRAKSFAPRSGLPQKQKLTAIACTDPLLVGAAPPRRKQSPAGAEQ